MKSEIKFISPNLKLILPVSIVSAITLIVIALVFRFEFGAILLSIAGSVALIGITLTIGLTRKVIHRGRIYGIEERKAEQELRLITYQADKAGLARYVLSFPKTQRLVTLPDSNVRVIEAIAEPTAGLLPASTNEPISLLSALDSEQRVLIVGASNSGKTELLKHIAYRRKAQVVIIDPHAFVDKWPTGQVVGIGRNYQEIDRTLQALVQLMQKRYQQIGRGEVVEGQHKPVCVIVDEWRAITGNLSNAGDALKTLLTESRKASMSMFVASHSDRAKPLGLSGEYDLKDGFVIVRLSVQDGMRVATIDNGNGEVPALLPGPFAGPVMESSEYINLEVEPTPTEAAILTLHRQGESFNEIARHVFGHTGGKQVDQIKQVLNKFNSIERTE